MSVKKQAVESLLDLGVTECRLAAEVLQVISGTRKTAIVSLVASRGTIGEHAILVLETTDDDTTVTLTHCYPLLADFGVRIVGDRTFEILPRPPSGEPLIFEAPTVAVMWAIISHMTRAFNLSVKEQSNGAPNGHVWVNDLRARHSMAALDLAELYSALPSPEAGNVVTVSDPGQGSGGSASGDGSLPPLPDREEAVGAESVEENGERGFFLSPEDMKLGWIKSQLKLREAEFTENREISMFIGTWNVNNKKPGEPLAEWLQTSSAPDLYVLGFQEVDMTVGALLREETGSSTLWEELITSELANTAPCKYTKVASKQLVGIVQVIFVKESLVKHVRDVRERTEGVGLMGTMGNKGAVAIRLKLFETTICFMCTHLAPHQNEVEHRNRNYHDLINRISFGGTEASRPLECDVIFWLGDLNYRIDDVPDHEVRRRIKEEDWQYLLDHEQLLKQRRLGRVFEGFSEAPVRFAPTYKYDSGTNNYDTSEKKRKPAWTDRVLWRGDNNNIRNRSYTRSELMTSDHKPVAATFTMDVKVVIESRKRACEAELMKLLNSWENDMLPQVSLDNLNFDFEDVRYGVPCEKSFTVANTGSVVAKFRFLDKHDTGSVSNKWLTVSPLEGILVPNQKEVVRLRVLVDARTAGPLSTGQSKFEDILIFHLEQGRDHFLTISGTWHRSCFGFSLEQLVSVHVPVRSYVPPSQLKAPKSPSAAAVPASEGAATGSEAAARLKLPKELWRLVDYIYRHGVQHKNLFKQEGSPEDVAQVREILDTGSSFSSYRGSIDSVAECLLQFLASLSEPVVPYAFYKRALEASTSASNARLLVSQFPPVHYNAFSYITAFLRELLLYAESNKLAVDDLATVFSEVLMRAPGEALDKVNAKKKKDFVAQFMRDTVDWTKGSPDTLLKPV